MTIAKFQSSPSQSQNVAISYNEPPPKASATDPKLLRFSGYGFIDLGSYSAIAFGPGIRVELLSKHRLHPYIESEVHISLLVAPSTLQLNAGLRYQLDPNNSDNYVSLYSTRRWRADGDIQTGIGMGYGFKLGEDEYPFELFASYAPKQKAFSLLNGDGNTFLQAGIKVGI